METHATDLTGIALVTSVAVICGLLLRQLRQPAIVGYIVAGAILGPTGFGLVHKSENIEVLAELGVLMLLFLIGMELSIRAFASVLRPAILCATFQMGCALLITFGLSYAFDWPYVEAMVMGFLVSLSSTAVAIKMLEDIGELRSQTGRITIGVLIAQDLAVVPMLILIREFGGGEAASPIVWLKVAGAMVFLAGVVWFLSRRQRIVLPTRWMHGEVDLIPLAALAFCFCFATAGGLLGLSPVYGAFLAGLIIANSTDRAIAIRATQPIQSVLLVVFFLSIGLLIDFNFIWDNIAAVLLLVFSVALVKTAINIAALKVLGQPWERAFTAGVVMGQIGEFSFVIAATGLSVAAIDREAYRLAISVIAFSLLISPLWMITARRFHRIAAGGIQSMRVALREVYGSELTMLGHAAAVAKQAGHSTAQSTAQGLQAIRQLVPRRRRLLPAPEGVSDPSPNTVLPATESVEK